MQTAFVELAADKNTASAVPSLFLSCPIVTAGGALCIWFSVTASNDQNNIHINRFEIRIDGGAPLHGAGFASTGPDHDAAVPLVYKATGIAAGAHTVEIWWSTGGGVLRCNPLTDANDSATVLVQEVTV